MFEYLVNIPGWAHCMSIRGDNKKHALQNFKQKHGMIRMPAGYGIWKQ